ncbi:hypothetical protein EVG20_g6074, partial [Dentipellis fragilis]
EDIVTMTDADTALIKTELWPTRDNILKAIQTFVHDAQPDDVFVFHYTGHSRQEKAKVDLNEEDGLDEFIVGCDHKALRDDLVHQHLVDPLPRGCRLTAILDACHSGTMLDLDHYRCHFRIQRRSSHTNLSEMYHSSTLKKRTPLRSSTLKPEAKLSLLSDAVTTAAVIVKTYVRFFRAALKVIIAMLRFRRRRDAAIVRGKNPFTCGAKCQFAPHMGAIVISISSCMDHEVTWEDRQCEGAAMTVPLVELLNEDPTITTGPLARMLTYRMAVSSVARCAMFQKEYRRLEAEFEAAKETLTESGRSKMKTTLEYLEHLKDFDKQWQRPQVGAMRKLPDDEPFIASKPRLLLLPPLSAQVQHSFSLR